MRTALGKAALNHGRMCPFRNANSSPISVIRELKWLRLVVAGLVFTVALGFSAQSARGQANVTGKWQTLLTQAPINPIHIAMMRNGQVLIVAGSGNVAGNLNYQAA